MMDRILTQFSKLKEIIDTNIEVLKNLVLQSIKLENLILSLQNGNPNDDIKTKLVAVKDEIDGDIANLVQSTHQLFTTYEKLIKEFF